MNLFGNFCFGTDYLEMQQDSSMDTAYFDSKAGEWDVRRSHVLRTEKIYDSIITELKTALYNSVLDFGCGTGLLGFHFTDTADTVTFADTSAGMLEQVRKKAATLSSSKIKTLDLTDHTVTEKYGIIVSLLALHHVDEVAETVCNLTSCVAEDGAICLSDLDLEDGSFHYPHTAPHNGIDRDIIIEALRKSGMRIVCNKTVYTEQKSIDGILKTYPIFLIIGQREANRI